MDCSNGTTLNNSGGAGGFQQMWAPGNNLSLIGKMRLTTVANGLYWIGWVQQNMQQFWAVSLPADDYAAFRFWQGTDTHWMCKSSGDGGTTVTSTDSGITPDTNFHIFKIVETTSIRDFKFYIDGNLVCTHTTNLPRTAALLVSAATQTNNPAASATHMDFAWFYEETDQ